MEDLDTTAMDTLIRQQNLKTVWAGRFEFTEEQREQLYTAAFEEWGPAWIQRIQEP